MSDSYLEIAEKTIREEKRPLHPKEIITIAKSMNLIPEHLHGKTQYKTLAARLSTEIRNHAKRSPFFRTAANRFFLKELKAESHNVYDAPKRQKTLHHEQVLTFNESFLTEQKYIGLFNNVDHLIKETKSGDHIKYVVRKLAETREDIKQVISYALIFQKGRILTYRRGIFTNAADELLGKRSIGFGGHVTEDDLSLFDTEGLGIIGNARRELSEELIFDKDEFIHSENPKSFNFLCGVNTYESSEAKKHIAIVLVYYCTQGFKPHKNELSINDLRWTDISQPENNLDDFEPWSQTILKALYSNEVSIDPN